MSKYNFEMDITPNSMLEKVVSRIESGSRVLEFGCAEGRMTRYLTEQKGCKVSVIELDSQAIEVAAKWAEDFYCGNLEQEGWIQHFADKKFDYLLFCDVLEHIRIPEWVLSSAKPMLKDNGEVIISIPNIAHHDILVNLIQDRFSYTDIGLLDNTHVHFWGKNNLDEFAHKCGFTMCVLDGVSTSAYATEQNIPSRIPAAIDEWLMRRPNNLIYQYFIVLKKEEFCDPKGFVNRLQRPNEEYAFAIYWDQGKGYQQNCITIRHPVMNEDGVLICQDMVIPPDSKKLRFDPVEGYCFVSGLKFVVDGTECEISDTNGISIPGGILFLTADPQIEVVIPSNASNLTIQACLYRFDEREAERFQAAIDGSPKVAELNGQLTAAQSNAEGLAQSYQKLLEQVHLQEERAEEEKTVLDRALHESETRNNNLLKENDGLKDELARTGAMLHNLEMEHSDLEKELVTVRTQFRDLEAGYRNLETVYNDIIHSRSYRYTAPLRSLMSCIKSSRVGEKLVTTHWYLRNAGLRVTVQKIIAYFKKKCGLLFHNLISGPISRIYHKIALSMRIGGFSETIRYCLFHRQYRKDPFKSDKHSRYAALLNFIEGCIENGGNAFVDGPLKHKSGELVLLVSHELNLTGAPVALENFAAQLLAMGKIPIIAAPHDDVLRKRLYDAGIPVVTIPEIYQSNLIPNTARLFQFIVVSTNVGAPLVAQLSGMDTPVVWWIHEAHASYFPGAVAAMPDDLGENIHVYCGGAYAQRLLSYYKPSYKSKKLLYYVPENKPDFQEKEKYTLAGAEGKTVFCVVGMLEERKGQDILVDAIYSITQEEREKSLFVFVGRECYPPIIEKIRKLCEAYPENVRYIRELQKNDLMALYGQMDCLICTSKDDPMPIVVTEAMALEKTIICSENTGSASLLQQTNGGYIYHNNDPAELAAAIGKVLSGSEELAGMGQRARKTYEKYFSYQAFSRNVAKVLRTILSGEQTLVDLADDFRCEENPGEEYLENVLRQYDENGKKNILLFSHELSLTGAPIVLHRLAHVLREIGYNVTIFSPFDGAMREQFTEDGFPVLVYEQVYADNLIVDAAKQFDLILVSTVVAYRVINQLGSTDVPVLWWIHDSKTSYRYFGECMPKDLPSNVSVFCGGAYAKKQLLTYYPRYDAEELLYAVDDCAAVPVEEGTPCTLKKAGRKLFIVVGTVEERKGQDIMVQAISLLTPEEKESCQFLFMGKVLDDDIMEPVRALLASDPEHVDYIEQVPHDELLKYYHAADCLVCCSRDDPMPVVVTEMQAMSKIVICSENTGSAALIEETGGGLIYRNDDAGELAEKIRFVLHAPEEVAADIGRKARITYEKYFSKQVFRDSVMDVVNRLCCREYRLAHTTVSVVIPTYNAGKQCENLMKSLRSQQGIGRLEIVAVDSGSVDGTQGVCERYGAKVIQITQAEFSHSYARNLGAENAAGEIILFMTQDAMPSGNDWIQGLIKPIIYSNVAAVSCREECPADTDLYYRIASWGHSNFLGIKTADQIGKMKPDMTPEEQRKMASLNDISCAVKRRIFKSFGYRFSYAEDLDLGLRLLKSGHQIALLHFPTVIHGHTRPASYYLRRGMAEAVSMKRIMEQPNTVLSSVNMAGFLVPAYIALETSFARMEQKDDPGSVSEFTQEWTKTLEECMNKVTQLPCPQGKDDLSRNCINLLMPYWEENKEKHWGLIDSLQVYYSGLVACLNETGWISKDYAVSICDCLRKQTALLMGTWLANLDPNESIYSEIHELTKGV